MDIATTPHDSTERFAQAMAGILARVPTDIGAQALPRIALAVSGGGDSMALCMLAQHWAQQHGAQLHAFTVDHGLRAESAQEAAQVAAEVKKLGIPHDILRWEGDKPQTRLQERARSARYHLLTQACRDAGIKVLLVAHNAEDQMETFWIRLSHGSGLDGLAAMSPVALRDDILLGRPLLGFSRAALRDICAAMDVAWMEDPSNKAEKFLRVRLRGFEDMLAQEGLTPQRLAQTSDKLAAARAALEFYAQDFLARHACPHAEGYISIDHAALSAAPFETQRRALVQCLKLFARDDLAYGPDDAQMRALCQSMVSPSFGGATLAGCEIFLHKKRLLIAREMAAVQGSATCGAWDGRFDLPPALPDSWHIRALGAEGLSCLRKNIPTDDSWHAAIQALPHKARLSLPAVFEGENILFIPLLGYQTAASSAQQRIMLSLNWRGFKQP